MLKVLRPARNKQTQGFSAKHPAYDIDDIPDTNYRASLDGTVTQSKNSETKNWQNTGKLTTRDYGNYIKIKGEVDGKTVYQLGAHFQKGTVLSKGKKVKAGQVVAQAGKTGNIRPLHGGDGSHSHTEYRDSQNKKIKVKFVEKTDIIKPMTEIENRAFTNLKIYRNTRKQGREGNFESFVNAIIGSDRDIYIILQNKKKEMVNEEVSVLIPTTSKRFRLNREERIKIAKGGAIATSAALVTYLLEVIPTIDFGNASVLVGAITAILVNILRQLNKRSK